MGLIIGPTPWWQVNVVSTVSIGTTLPDGSRIICKSGGTAWIVAPSYTQVSSAWAGGQYNSTLVGGDKCCICEWPELQTRLISCGFNPSDWFVPSASQLLNPGYICRSNWDIFTSTTYWSSTELCNTHSCILSYNSGIPGNSCKEFFSCVRAFRCVTY